jgi:hypothetical protein
MRLSSEYDEELIRLERTAGLDSIVFRNTLAPISALTIYYEQRGHYEPNFSFKKKSSIIRNKEEENEWVDNDFEK